MRRFILFIRNKIVSLFLAKIASQTRAAFATQHMNQDFLQPLSVWEHDGLEKSRLKNKLWWSLGDNRTCPTQLWLPDWLLVLYFFIFNEDYTYIEIYGQLESICASSLYNEQQTLCTFKYRVKDNCTISQSGFLLVFTYFKGITQRLRNCLDGKPCIQRCFAGLSAAECLA